MKGFTLLFGTTALLGAYLAGAAPVVKVNTRALSCLPVRAHTSSWELCCTVYATGGICRLPPFEARSIKNLVERFALAEPQDAGCLPVGAVAGSKECCCTRIVYDGVCQHVDKREEVRLLTTREEDVCVSLGGKASLKKSCCAQLSDQGGYCQPVLGPCLPNGSSQSLYAECCSDFWYFGICLPQPTNTTFKLLNRNADLAETGCLIAGHHTHSEEHCCSGNAELGICQPIHEPCAPIGARNGPCCSAFFESGVCQPFPPTEFNELHKNHTVLSRIASPSEGRSVQPKATRAMSPYKGPCLEGSTDPACGGLHGARNLENAFCPLDSTAPGCAQLKEPSGVIITDSESFDKTTTRAIEGACPLDASRNPVPGYNGAVPIPSHNGGQPVISNLKLTNP